ncbi:MAG: hypothetical protein Q8P32_00735 [Candidatus Komeilibacteria bacterium]|nr:hypothetical protein [Candidatus Komeilibacteria bacterium]
MLKYLVLVGAVVQLIGISYYIKETLRGHTKPNKVTWLLWTIAPMIGTLAALSNGVTWAVIPTFIAGFGPLLVFIASFINRNAYWKLEKFDYLCGLFSVLALVLWAITKEPLVAIMLAIVSDGFAAIPTLIKSWKYPETETISPYVAGLFSSLTSFFAITTWQASAYSFPFYLVIMNILLITSLTKHKFKKSL